MTPKATKKVRKVSSSEPNIPYLLEVIRQYSEDREQPHLSRFKTYVSKSGLILETVQTLTRGSFDQR